MTPFFLLDSHEKALKACWHPDFYSPSGSVQLNPTCIQRNMGKHPEQIGHARKQMKMLIGGTLMQILHL